MATQMFIKIDDIKGESQIDKHKEEIDIIKWEWGISQPGKMATGGGGGVGRASFHDLTFIHNVDKASPNLMKICATGEHKKEAKLAVRKAGGNDDQDYMIITMKDVFCTKVVPAGSNGEEELTEAVSLQFSNVTVEYSPQKGDGSLDAAISFSYDIKANKLE